MRVRVVHPCAKLAHFRSLGQVLGAARRCCASRARLSVEYSWQPARGASCKWDSLQPGGSNITSAAAAALPPG